MKDAFQGWKDAMPKDMKGGVFGWMEVEVEVEGWKDQHKEFRFEVKMDKKEEIP